MKTPWKSVPHTVSLIISPLSLPGASLMVPVVKNLPANAGDARDPGGIPGSGRSPGEGHGNPLQYSYLEILWTVGPGGLQSIGSQRVGYDTAYSHAF